MCIYSTLRSLSKNADPESVSLGWDLRFYISNKLPGKTNVAGLQIILLVASFLFFLFRRNILISNCALLVYTNAIDFFFN